MDKVTGLVEAVGTKFHGSLKVNGCWYNMKKGVVNTAKQGDAVSLTLVEYDFKGKKGVNVGAIDVVAGVPAVTSVKTGIEQAKASNFAPRPEYKQRDFEKEAVGKTRCSLFGDALRSPALAQLASGLSIDDFIGLCVEAAERGVEYTFEGK